MKQPKKGENSAQRKRIFRPTLPPKEKTQGNKTKVTVQGTQKLCGTRRSTNTATIISSFNMIPNADPQLKGVTLKRNSSPTQDPANKSGGLLYEAKSHS